jgi:WD domain, G-beta repeat/PQQ-like domain
MRSLRISLLLFGTVLPPPAAALAQADGTGPKAPALPANCLARLGQTHRARIFTLAFSPDGKKIATGSYDETIRVWSVAGRRELLCIHTGQKMISAVAFSPDGRTLASSAFRDSVVRLWDSHSGKALGRLGEGEHEGSMVGVAFSPDGKLLATAPRGGPIYLWDLTTRKPIRKFRGSEYIYDLAFSQDGRALASSGRVPVGQVYLWDVATGKERWRLPGTEPRGIWHLAFSPNGRRLAAADFNRGILLVDVATGRVLRELVSDRKNFGPLAFSPDGRTLAAGDHRGRIHVWELATGGLRRKFSARGEPILHLAFSPDGRALASADDVNRCLVWDFRAPEGACSDLPVKQPDAFWADLASADARRAYQAHCALSRTPRQAVLMLRQRLRPVSRVEGQRMERLILDLDHHRFARRERASQELVRLGKLAAAPLRSVLAQNPSLEVRRRASEILRQLPATGPTAEELAGCRGVELLEIIGTPEARRLLRELAEGAPGFLLTQEAVSALQRLAPKTQQSP